MLRRFFIQSLVALLVALCCVTCATAQTVADETWKMVLPVTELGVEITLLSREGLAIGYGMIDGDAEPTGLRVFFPCEELLLFNETLRSRGLENVSEEEQNAIAELPENGCLSLLVIERREERALDESSAENPPEAVTGAKGAVEIGRQDGYAYIAYEPENDISWLSENDIALYETCKALVPGMRESIKLIPIGEPVSLEDASLEDALPAFAGVDLEGNPVTNDIFKGKKVTMINFWGTFCSPCIQEMPDLGELARNLPDGAQLVGIVIDVSGDQNLELAREIMAKANAGFMNIVPDQALLAYCDNLIGVPTTIFVDENGALLGEPALGSYSAEGYLAVLEGYLK